LSREPRVVVVSRLWSILFLETFLEGAEYLSITAEATNDYQSPDLGIEIRDELRFLVELEKTGSN
jgi:hypothetical protein